MNLNANLMDLNANLRSMNINANLAKLKNLVKC